MNENMEKLMGLIKETNKVIENLKEETKEIKEKNTQDRSLQLRRMIDDINEYADIVKELNVGVSPGLLVHMPEHQYALELRYYKPPRYAREKFDIAVSISRNGRRDYLGCISDGTYSMFKNGDRYCLRNHIDNILELWDEEDFEEEFAISVNSVIENRAKEANADYESAKKGATV